MQLYCLEQSAADIMVYIKSWSEVAAYVKFGIMACKDSFQCTKVENIVLKLEKSTICKFGMNICKWFGTKMPQPLPGFSWLVVLAGFPILSGEVRKSVQFMFPTCEPRESVVNWIACKQDDEFPRHSGRINRQKIFLPTLANCHLDSRRLTDIIRFR